MSGNKESGAAAARRPGLAGKLTDLALDLTPYVFAALAFVAGVLILASSATPLLRDRLSALLQVAPIFVVELSHFASSVVGFLLLVVSAGLWRRREGAYWTALALLALGAGFSLLRGLEFEMAILLGVTAGALAPCRAAFNRRSRLNVGLTRNLTGAWLLLIVAVVGAVAWLGFFAYRGVAYTDALWWTFLRDADASRFLRAGAALAVLTLLLAARVLLMAPVSGYRGRPSSEDLDRAAAVIARAEVAQEDAPLALLGDKDLLFSESGESFLMFRVYGSRWIAMGEPVGRRDERQGLLWRFAEMADRDGDAPVFYGVSPDLLPELIDLGLTVRKIGETAEVQLARFSLEGRPRQALRTARNRAGREGVRFEVLERGAARAEAEVLRAVSDSWLSRQKGGEKGFSMGRFDIDYLSRTRLAVVRLEDRIVAFANLWETPGAVAVDLMRYAGEAPPYVMDYLFAELLLWAKAEGAERFGLGAAPLSGLHEHRLAPLLTRLGALLFEEGGALYSFKGLRAYKDKFDPVWEPRYLAAPSSAPMATVLLDVALLTGRGWRGLVLPPRPRTPALQDRVRQEP
jgi:phosphatidylglycerol lysyltransferase